MNLDKSNFNKTYQLMISQIKDCDLIAFDLEYSGIKLSEQSNYNLFDTMEDRYQHVKSCSQSFTTFQLGIVLFTRIVNERSLIFNNSSKFLTKTYNINLFPTGTDLFDTNFTCSAAALKFLRTNHMNINDIIDKGVGFLNKEEFSQLKSRLDSYSNVQGILTEEQQRMLDAQRRNISEWLTKSNDMCLQLPPIEKFSPYFQQMYFRSHFTNISTKFVDDFVLVEKVDALTRFSIDQKEDEMDLSSEKYKFCMDMLGVSKIWKLISRLKKPIVGHNCLFDLITVYQKFFANLPETFEEFRYELNKVLPTIYDTKFIFGRMRMTFKSLAEIDGGLQTIFNALSLLNSISKNDGVLIEEDSNHCDYEKGRMCQAHEAGYDSYMTGCCVLYLANMLYKKEQSGAGDQSGGGERAGGGGDGTNHYDKMTKKPLKIAVASFETYEVFLRGWKNYVNVIKAHEFCVCFDVTVTDDRCADNVTDGGNRLLNTRPPFLIVYDRRPDLGPMQVEESPDEIEGQPSTSEEQTGTETPVEESPAEVYFSQGFLEQLLCEFGHANVRRLDDDEPRSTREEHRQRFLVAMSSYSVMRVFTRNVKKRWPRLVVREYSRLADHRRTRNCFLAVTGLSAAVSVWSLVGLVAMCRQG